MPTVSHRSETVPLSPFRKLIPVADRAKAAGRHVYHLNIGQPDIKTHPRAVEQFRKLEWDVLEYSPSNGIASYRQALTRYYERFDVQLSAENILVTTGGSEAILFFMLACLDPGDEIIVPEPFYANYNGYAHIADVRVVAITSHIEDGFSHRDRLGLQTVQRDGGQGRGPGLPQRGHPRRGRPFRQAAPQPSRPRADALRVYA